MWMNGSRSAEWTPANARRTGKPSPSTPLGAVVTDRTGRSVAATLRSGDLRKGERVCGDGWHGDLSIGCVGQVVAIANTFNWHTPSFVPRALRLPATLGEQNREGGAIRFCRGPERSGVSSDTIPENDHLECWPGEGTPTGAVLALHGGRVRGHRQVGRLDLPVLRMRCLARAVHQQVAPHGVAVWVLRFDVQGWNGIEASPVDDARQALQEIARHGNPPVVILGHSMGGRTAMRVAGEPNVCGVVALAPWLPAGEPMGDLTDRRLLIAHGTGDRTTDPRLSRSYASKAWGVATKVRHIDVEGDGHALLRRPTTWNRIAGDAALEMLGVGIPQGSDR